MRKYMIAALAVVMLIVGTNYWVDPAGMSTKGREQQIADILLSGKNAAVPRSQVDFEERRLLREVAMGIEQRPATLAFGSSRFRYITRQYLNDPTFFNHAINAATLEDLYTLYWYYRERRMTPQRMLIALDPWMIDQNVSYIQLINLAYSNDFVLATSALQLTLTSNNKTVFSSAISEANRDYDTAVFPLSVDDGVVLNSVGDNGPFEVISFTIPEAGTYELTFQARITTGTYYYGLDVQSDRSGTLLEGGYLGPLADNQLPAVHDFRTFRVSSFDASAGEIITINMLSTTGHGVPVPGAGQNLEVRDVKLLRSCSRDVQPISTFNATCIMTRVAREANKYAWLRDLLSPAYFQQSLGRVGDYLMEISRSGEADEQILPIDDCVSQGAYTWCADGSVSPPESRKSVAEVMDILRAVDSGLVPLINPDLDQLQNLQKFVDILRQDKVELQLFLVPVHPFMYERWNDADDEKGFVAAEQLYRDFAGREGVPIFGSYDPEKLNMGPECFRDWVHPYPECLELVLDEARL